VTGVTALPEVGPGDIGAGQLSELLHDTGAVVLRDAGVTSADALAALAGQLSLAARDQPEPFAARRRLGRGVWSGPAWPATSPMCMHHELGWETEPPSHLLVACLKQAESGGRTGVADGRVVLGLLPNGLVERADSAGWTLTRRHAEGVVGMPWPTAFASMDRSDVEAYAAAEDIELTWSADCLVTRRIRPAIRMTGADGVPAWSNLLAFCSEWTMDPMVRDYLVETLGRDALPYETEFGDGSPFTADDVETVNGAYDQATAYIAWRAGDVLLLDNVRTAHSMEPFTGDRQMAVLHAVAA
jgi:TfdA family taurine catabolism dioxygenase TauD